MSTVYRLSKTGTKLLYKVRHHKGHGVHSPFVFNLIHRVIEEKLPYYSYIELESYLKLFPDRKLSLRKDNKLAFRLVNYFASKNILEIGAGIGVNTLCLTAPSNGISCVAIESDKAKFDLASKLYTDDKRNIIQHTSIANIPSEASYDCIYINLNNYHNISNEELDKLIMICHQKSFIMVKGIRKTKKQNKLWKRLSENETRTAELDLFDVGVLFFDKQLYRWKYQISF